MLGTPLCTTGKGFITISRGTLSASKPQKPSRLRTALVGRPVKSEMIPCLQTWFSEADLSSAAFGQNYRFAVSEWAWLFGWTVKVDSMESDWKEAPRLLRAYQA